MNGLLDILVAMAIILGIVVLGGITYSAIWIFLFTPIRKLDDRNERLAEANREFNKIEVKHAQLVKFTEEQQKIYDEYVLNKQKVLDETSKLEDELKRKQRLKKDYEKEFSIFNQWRETSAGKKAFKKYEDDHVADA
jgi:hypothetical protein